MKPFKSFYLTNIGDFYYRIYKVSSLFQQGPTHRYFKNKYTSKCHSQIFPSIKTDFLQHIYKKCIITLATSSMGIMAISLPGHETSWLFCNMFKIYSSQWVFYAFQCTSVMMWITAIIHHDCSNYDFITMHHIGAVVIPCQHSKNSCAVM
jgi:hypothetical protein